MEKAKNSSLLIAISTYWKRKQIGKYIHKYIIAKKSSSKNVKITHNEFCGVIYDYYICVPAFLEERERKKNVRTLHYMYKPRERVLNPYRREWV